MAEIVVMKNTKKVETSRVISVILKIITVIMLIGFAGLAIHNISILTTKLDESTENIERLEQEKAQQQQTLEELEEHNSNLDSEKKSLEEKNKELEQKLQSKLDAQKKAQATLASQKTVKISGTCQDWMQQAGITDFNNAFYIFQRESGCNPQAVNKSSGAYGVCQALPGSKMASAGSDWQTNPVTQMKWCNSYAKSRYGSWVNAVAFWNKNKWW